MENVRGKVLAYIREQGLLQPGDRVGAAVSGGADSVGLLQLLLELRLELGIVLSVIHFNHKLRGPEADEDERFVAKLADEHGLPFHSSSADVRALAAERKQSLETAGREARYQFLESFFHNQLLDAVATGHTMDDQAETVLMRVLRGAGTKGMGGIFPLKKMHAPGGISGRIIRPLLSVRRCDVRSYLQSAGCSWREDATNVDLQYTRNRIRHGLLPLIETRFKPNAVPALAHLAEVAREEESYWQAEVARVLPAVLRPEPGSCALSLHVPALLATRPALQRRIMRHCGQLAGLTLDFEHLEQVLRILRGGSGRECELPGGWLVVREPKALRFEPICRDKRRAADYEYRLPLPGEVEVREIGAVIRAFLRPVKPGSSCCGEALDRRKLGNLVVRNWRPGDRLWLAHSKAPKKMKELLQEKRIAAAQRKSWPVVASDEAVIWARGFGSSSQFRPENDSREVVVIEEHVPANVIAGE